MKEIEEHVFTVIRYDGKEVTIKAHWWAIWGNGRVLSIGTYVPFEGRTIATFTNWIQFDPPPNTEFLWEKIKELFGEENKLLRTHL